MNADEKVRATIARIAARHALAERVVEYAKNLGPWSESSAGGPAPTSVTLHRAALVDAIGRLCAERRYARPMVDGDIYPMPHMIGDGKLGRVVTPEGRRPLSLWHWVRG